MLTIECMCELLPPQSSLYLYSPGEVEYTDVLVRRINDNLTLVCEQRGDGTPRVHVWNFVPSNATVDRTVAFTVDPQGPTLASTLTKLELQPEDSGQYMCSAPPYSVTKYILVQTNSLKHCARGAFSCGERCVLPAYVCDGRSDCRDGEDEALHLCRPRPCARPDKLNCSSGRCVSAAACCAPAADALCRQPACCDEHARYSRDEGYMEAQYPPLFEDRHAPDDYGFIQSTIYTVTACALIFMIAVVLLVSAICKMHMKRAALRSYAQAERATRRHYGMQYAQVQGGRFPPCYEAARLLETSSPLASPTRRPLQGEQACAPPGPPGGGPPPGPPPPGAPAADEPTGFGLARLSSIFSSRYRQVPTQCYDVEMTAVRSTSLTSSPTRSQNRLDPYRSPTYCDLNSTEFYFTNPEAGDCGRDLNYMATPVEFFRRRALRRNTLERVMEHIGERQRPITLQLGRFQFSIPRFGRRASTERRPDTPNIAEINVDDLDFVRLNSNDTYTLNGRTIRLLGADFENYPVLPDGSVRPPYTDAMRYKLYGPPPEYLSRDTLNTGGVNVGNDAINVDEEARNNVEMPPCYEELATGVDANANVNNITSRNVTERASTSNCDANVESLNSVIDNLPAIDSDVNANEPLDNVNNEITVNGN
ncbi:LOW QUALITY PROTEIN: uncharacterized protein ACR2FA_009839 [Aphomia sociella]